MEQYNNIHSIETLDYDTAEKLAIEKINIKDHEVFFIDFEPPFGYSAVVFFDKMHIRYANDYQLHHSRFKTTDELRDFYIETLNRKLYTVDELLNDEINTYEDFRSKEYYLRNYHIQKFDYLSFWHISKPGDNYEQMKKNYPYTNNVSFCYVKDPEIITLQTAILEHLYAEFAKLKSDDEKFKTMIRYELANHEACYSYNYKPALDALGLKFENLTKTQQRIVLKELDRQIAKYN